MFVCIRRWHARTKVAYAYQQTAYLVNIKLKWVKDRSLDAVVAQERDLRPACFLVSMISSAPSHCLPIYHLSRQHRQLGLPEDLKLSTFIRRYPTLFHEFPVSVKGGSVPWFKLTNEALELHREELDILQKHETDLVQRLQKLLMLTQERTLPLQTVEQLKWDMGLPYDYQHSLIPRYSHLFSVIHLPDQRVGLKLQFWDESLAISQFEKNAMASLEEKGVQQLAFPIKFTRGFGLKKKCMKWLEEWQSLPYTSPYTDASHLDSRTDVSEKRIVGVFHELLNLMIGKRTERKNVSNLRKRLQLPQKFTKVFGRHPGIFYISQKCSTQTVILREAYDRQELINKHPLAGIRERYAIMMKIGFQNRSRGLYKKLTDESQEQKDHQKDVSGDKFSRERSTEGLTYSSDLGFLLEENIDKSTHAPI